MSMATVYRDYGAIGESSYPPNNFNITKRRQVYQATHEGEIRLPFMKRSFISFTYGGRYIEDFNLIATISGDRMEKDGYATFNDLTTEYDNLDGYYYWNTHFKTNVLTFDLATDGINQRELEDFLHWFQPGKSRELILAEHPNRAQYARVSQPPKLALLPFEEHTTMMVSYVEREITTTLYKGEITLELTLDEPFWYAKDNVLGIIQDVPLDEGGTQRRYVDKWVNFDGETVNIFASQDALKILQEDNIPLGSMIDSNMLLGNKAYANVSNDTNSLIWSPAANDADIEYIDWEPQGQGARIAGVLTEYQYVMQSSGIGAEGYKENEYHELEPDYHYLTTETNIHLHFDVPLGVNPQTGKSFIEHYPATYRGRIAGPIVDVEGEGIDELSRENSGYFYYAGTAPSPTIITFTFQLRQNSNNYINEPANKIDTIINNTDGSTDKYYNEFYVTSKETQILKFTTPNFLTSFNRLMRILDLKYNIEHDWEAINKDIRDKVRHPAVRAWAIRIIDAYKRANNVPSIAELKDSMSYLLKDKTIDHKLYPVTVSFNSKTGEAIGTFTYRKPTETIPNINDIPTYGEIAQKQKEDVGDMLYSNYIVIRERNYPTQNGQVVSWRNDPNDPWAHSYSHKISHDMIDPLTNIQIEYQTLYL